MHVCMHVYRGAVRRTHLRKCVQRWKAKKWKIANEKSEISIVGIGAQIPSHAAQYNVKNDFTHHIGLYLAE